uniref:Uncharacterized protein n=1 Tax=Acrobeloides nanus TaxID=290746 RepID=A0A914DCF5_9BILA
MYKTNDIEHHDSPTDESSALTREVKAIIFQGVEENKTATQIQDIIIKRKINPTPNQKQIENAITRCKKNLYGTKLFTLEELISYAQRASTEPEDNDEPYRVSHIS